MVRMEIESGFKNISLSDSSRHSEERPEVNEPTSPIITKTKQRGSLHLALDASKLRTHHASTNGYTNINRKAFECHTSIGLRPTQEDRLILTPSVFHDDIAIAGVFDGTVGHYASQFIMENFMTEILKTKQFQQVIQLTIDNNSTLNTAEMHGMIANLIRESLKTTFLTIDSNLLRYCDERNLHYASSTGVTAVLWRDMLTIAHVGDSKACIAKVVSNNSNASKSRQNDAIAVEWLTIDHKPNMPHELQRIQQSGGSLVWLHGNKAYIRGGDFFARQAKGDHPKQLNYSRAFGGKDLKKYGLIVDPDINHFEIQRDDKLVLLASDGLWDAIEPILACEIAFNAKKQNKSAAKELVERAIRDMPSKGVSDNVTVIAIFLNDDQNGMTISEYKTTTNKMARK